MKLLTIICEAHARAPVVELLRRQGAHGWTVFPVEGEGAQGQRHADIPEYANLQFQAVVRPAVAESVLDELGRDFFPRFAMIAFTSDVQVLRRDKF